MRLIWFDEDRQEWRHALELNGMSSFSEILKSKDKIKHLAYLYNMYHPLAASNVFQGDENGGDRYEFCIKEYYDGLTPPEFVIKAGEVYKKIVGGPAYEAMKDISESLVKARKQLHDTDTEKKDDNGEWVYDVQYILKQTIGLQKLAEGWDEASRKLLTYEEQISAKNRANAEERIGTDGQLAEKVRNFRK